MKPANLQKGFGLISILVLILIVISIPIGLYLIKHPQLLNSKAAINPIVFVNSDNYPVFVS